MPEIVDSLVVGFELKQTYHMPLFVVLAEGVDLTDALKEKIKKKLFPATDETKARQR